MVYHSLLFRSFQTKTCLVLFSKDALSSRVDLNFSEFMAQQVSPRWPASEYQNDRHKFSLLTKLIPSHRKLNLNNT
jgi:hypothetical protein